MTATNTARKTLTIGSRGSHLALWQAHHTAGLLARFGIPTEIKTIKTTGDQVQDKPLADIGGKGLFTKELEQALLDRHVDFAVHSFKDVPVTMPLVDQADLIIAAVPELVAGFRDQPGGFVPTIDVVKDGVELCNTISAIGVCLVTIGVLGFVGLLLKSLKGGSTAVGDPVDGHTLEWATASPPPAGNFAEAVAAVRTERPLLDIKEAQ